MLAVVTCALLLSLCSGETTPPATVPTRPTTSGVELEDPEVQRLSYRVPGAPRTQYNAPSSQDQSFKPYSFNYVAEGEDGMSSRQESADNSGRVVGSYSLSLEDGRKRTVEYIADENGFRANVDTNEQGTESQNPANVIFYSHFPGNPSTTSRGYGGAEERAPQGLPQGGSRVGYRSRSLIPVENPASNSLQSVGAAHQYYHHHPQSVRFGGYRSADHPELRRPIPLYYDPVYYWH